MNNFPKNITQTFTSLLIIYGVLIFSLLLSLSLRGIVDNNILFVLTSIIMLLFNIFIFQKLNRTRFYQNITFSSVKIHVLLYVLLSAFFLQISISYPFYFLLNEREGNNLMIKHQGIPNFAILFSSLLITPVLEELLFRQIIFKNLLKKNTALFAIISSTILFTLSHPSIPNFVSVFLLGLSTSYLYYIRKNIIYPIFFHFAFNLSTFIIYYFRVKYSFITFNSLYGSYTMFIILFALISYAYFLYKTMNSKK